MKNIQAVKIGNVVNVSLAGKLHKKNCGSPEEANELFELVLEAKADPSDENIKAIRAYLNEKLRVAYLTGLENDPETGEVFLAGFNTPLPTALVEVIREYHENGWNMDALINFWTLLMLNPDERVRNDLFGFIGSHDFSVTDKGYMVVYKAVANKKDSSNDPLAEFVGEQYLHVKKDWKCSPNKYGVYQDEDGVFAITKSKTLEKWMKKNKNVEIFGKLGDLYDKIVSGAEDTPDAPAWTDKHTRTMNIELGVPVVMDRSECDADPQRDCSYGLHVGATSYVESFGNNGDTVLVCLVNPAHVVAVPSYDNSKMRVSEYFPYAIAKYEDGKIDIVEEAYFENDYGEWEADAIEELVEKIQANQKPIEKAKNSNDEVRPMSELKKLLETRLVDLQ